MSDIPLNLDKLIIDSVGAMVIVTDRRGEIIYFNRGGQRMMGFTENEVRGRPIWDVFPPPEYRQRTKARFESLMAGEELEIEAVWLTQSGGRKHLSCYCIGVAGASGEIEYTIGTGVDTTERTETEQALRESEERFRTTFDDASIGMAVVNEQGRYLHVNRAFCHLISYEQEELLNLDFFALTHPDDREHNRENFERLFRNKIASYVLEKRYIQKNRKPVWVQVSASIASGGHGKPATIIGLFENISERRATREKLEKAYRELSALNETLEQRVQRRTAELQARTEELDQSKQLLVEQSRILRSVLDSMGDGVIVADGTGTVVLMNPAAKTVTGTFDPTATTIQERSQRPWFYHADGQTQYAPEDLPLVRSLRGEAVDDMEVLIRRPGTPQTWTSATSRPLLNEAGKPDGAVVVIRDVSDRKRHEAELEAANAQLRESEGHYKELADSHLRLAREVEHRVRNNLQGLLGLLSVMRNKAANVPSFADAMESRIEGMTHVHQLLAETQWKGVGMRELVDGALATLQHMSCESAEINVVGPDVFIGPRQLMPLTLVLVEWFTNSCKYGAHSVPGGRLEIRWEIVDGTHPPLMRLRWTERGGPAVGENRKPSLGTELVEGFVGRELAGTVELRYPPAGADHVLEFVVRDEGFVPGETNAAPPSDTLKSSE